MKRLFYLALVLIISLPSMAQTTMKAVFLSAPDSILPMMTQVNRLDCVDFIENNMEAKVKNKLQEPVVLEALTQNYLRLKTSEVSNAQWKLVSDNIVMVNTCSAPASDSNVILYTSDWKKIKDFERPDITEFFNTDCNMQSDSILTLKAEIETLPLMTAKLSPDDNTITWTIETSELTAEVKKTAANCLHSITRNINDF